MDNPDQIKVTVIIACFNQEKLIVPCLESVKWADEILVVDSYSTDKTVEIARKYTDRVLQHEYVNYATQINWAVPQAAHDWIFIVDSDEEVEEVLEREVLDLLKTEPEKDAYWIGRKNFLFGMEVRHSGWGGERVLRVFRKKLGRYKDKRVHSRVDIQNTGNLNGSVLHIPITSMSEWVSKINKYSTWKSQDKFEKRTWSPVVQMILRPPVRFFKDYLLRLGILDGWRGFLIAAMSAFAELVMSSKVVQYSLEKDMNP